MSFFSTDPGKIKERITRYERELRDEYKKFKAFDDGYGKRYLLGPLYLLLGDNKGALKSFRWFEKNFPDDIGDPFHYLCWSLALYRTGNLSKAEVKLRQAMLSNLYLLPNLLGIKQERLDIQHTSNIEEEEYILSGLSELKALWDESALDWAKTTYESEQFQKIRSRYIEIYHELMTEHSVPIRIKLINEASELEHPEK